LEGNFSGVSTTEIESIAFMSTTKAIETRGRLPLADRLKMGLTEGIEFARGERERANTVVPPGRSFTGEEVVAIRTRRHMSRAQFARLLAVSVKTLQSWEQGVRKPSRPTMRLLQIFDQPDQFRSVLVVHETVGKAVKVKSGSSKATKKVKAR